MSPKGALWDHYHTDGKGYKTNKSHQNAFCRGCIREKVVDMQLSDAKAVETGTLALVRPQIKLMEDAVAAVTPICGRKESMAAHFNLCQNIPDTVKEAFNNGPGSSGETNEKEGKRPKTQATFNVVSKPRWSEQLHAEFGSDLCKLFVRINTAWRSAQNPQFELFVNKWIPGAVIPDCHMLSGPILKAEVDKIESALGIEVKGRYGTGQCDGWKNISKTSLVGSMVTVNYTAYTLHLHDISASRKTGENLLQIVKSEIKYCEEKLGITIIAWCSDAGRDAKKMRKLLMKERPEVIVPDCWAHQANLMVSDILKRNGDLVTCANEAVEIIKWFNSHSVALGLLRKEQIHTYKKACALILPVLTRWTTHHASCTRLLDINKAIKSVTITQEEELLTAAGKKAEHIEKARQVLSIVNRASFWINLGLLQAILRPLAIVTNVSQAANTRLDHVLLTLRNLYRIYSSADKEATGLTDDVCSCILSSLERRWGNADQKPFILALFFNPWIRAKLFSAESSFNTPNRLFGIIKEVWARIYPNEQRTSQLLKDMQDYFHGRGIFSDNRMNLKDYEENSALEDVPVNIIDVWTGVDTGENQFIRLAI